MREHVTSARRPRAGDVITCERRAHVIRAPTALCCDGSHALTRVCDRAVVVPAETVAIVIDPCFRSAWLVHGMCSSASELMLLLLEDGTIAIDIARLVTLSGVTNLARHCWRRVAASHAVTL